jgi:CDGSH-type Zn-finger protein
MDNCSIKLLGNGPYVVSGPFNIVDEDGKEYTVEKEIVALCRCGDSSNKPFCDGTHRKVEFEAESKAR